MKEMETQVDYFKSVADLVRERRMKGEYTDDERRIYDEGKEDACRHLLQEIFPDSNDIFAKYDYTPSELHNFIMLEIAQLREKLQKARRIFVANQKQIKNLTELSFPDLTLAGWDVWEGK